MRDYTYADLARDRRKFVGYINSGHPEWVPEAERQLAREEAERYNRAWTLMNRPCSGKPGPDCPF